MQPKFDYTVVANVRDWHMARLKRWMNGKLQKGEALRDIVRSAELHDTLTRQLGDSLYVNWNSASRQQLDAAGYRQNRD